MRTIGKNYYQRIIPIARRGYQEYVVKGTRIPVWRIMKHLSEGMDEQALLQKGLLGPQTNFTTLSNSELKLAEVLSLQVSGQPSLSRIMCIIWERTMLAP